MPLFALTLDLKDEPLIVLEIERQGKEGHGAATPR